MLAHLWADRDTQDRPELILVRTRIRVVALEQTVAKGRTDQTTEVVWPVQFGCKWFVLCITQIELTVQSHLRWIIGREIPYTS
jgi:hypothetical protein